MDHGEPVNIRDHSGEKRGTIERKKKKKRKCQDSERRTDKWLSLSHGLGLVSAYKEACQRFA